MSFTKSIAAITSINAIGVIVSLIFTVALAKIFGVGREVEIYFAASQLFAVLAAMAQSGQLGELFLPYYHELEHQSGSTNADRAFSALLNYTALGVSAIVAATMIVGAPVLAHALVPGFSEADKAAVSVMLCWLAPVLLIKTASTLLQTIANAKFSFGKAETANLAGRVASLICLLFLHQTLGVWCLVLALWLSSIIELIYISVILFRRGFRYSPTLKAEGFRVRTLASQLGATSSYIVATQIYAFALNAAISYLPQGVFGAFKYAVLIFSRTRGLILRPVSVVFFTHFSKAFSTSQTAVSKITELAFRRGTAVVTTIIFFSFVCLDDFLRALWESNEFPESRIRDTIFFLSIYIGLLIFSFHAQTMRKVAISLGYGKSQYYGASLIHLIAGLVAWFSIPALQDWGIALTITAQSLMVFAVPSITILAFERQYYRFYDLKTVTKWLVCCLFAYIPCLLLDWNYAPTQALGLIALGTAKIFAAGLVILVVGKLLRVEEVDLAHSKVRQKLSRALP